MITKQQARDRAMELAVESGDADLVASQLRDEGLGGMLSEDELIELVIGAGVMRHHHTMKPRLTLPRIVGVIALMMGLLAFVYGVRGYSTLAIGLGLTLIISPASAYQKR